MFTVNVTDGDIQFKVEAISKFFTTFFFQTQCFETYRKLVSLVVYGHQLE